MKKLKEIDYKTLGRNIVMILIGAVAMASAMGIGLFFRDYKVVFQSPVVIKRKFVTPQTERDLLKQEIREEIRNENENSDEASLEPTSEVFINNKQSWTGTASYYSRDACVGCSESLLMANGQPLDDSALTVAFNKLPLGSMVKVRNMENDMIVEAEVTDRHGADNAKYGWRIADLSVATKQAIGCGDLCEVKVYAQGGGEQ